MTIQITAPKVTHAITFDLACVVECALSIFTGVTIMVTSLAATFVIGGQASMFIFALMAPTAALLMVLTHLDEKASNSRTRKGGAITATATIAFWVSAFTHIYSLMGHTEIGSFTAGTTVGLLAGSVLVIAFLFTPRKR